MTGPSLFCIHILNMFSISAMVPVPCVGLLGLAFAGDDFTLEEESHVYKTNQHHS